jgi:hypothetical protein
MYRDPPANHPDEVLCFIVRSIAGPATLTGPREYGTSQMIQDVQHMQRLVNERLAQGFIVREHKSVAVDANHALLTFVLAKIS